MKSSDKLQKINYLLINTNFFSDLVYNYDIFKLKKKKLKLINQVIVINLATFTVENLKFNYILS